MSNGYSRSAAYNKEKIHVNLARMKKQGHEFELVLKDPDLALDFKHGKDVDINDVLETPQVFKDGKKGEIHSPNTLKEVFGTEDNVEAAKIILRDGEVLLTAEHRKKLFDAKKQRLLEYIHKNAVDPKTKLPHPLQRLELAMEQAKAHVDPYIPIEKQMEKIINQLRPIIALSFETAHILVHLSPRYAGAAYAGLKRKYTFKNETWLDDGSVQFQIEVPAGTKLDVFNDINNLTNGEATVEEVKQ